MEGPLVAAAGGCGGWIGERRGEGDCVLKDNAEACLAAGRAPEDPEARGDFSLVRGAASFAAGSCDSLAREVTLCK